MDIPVMLLSFTQAKGQNKVRLASRTVLALDYQVRWKHQRRRLCPHLTLTVTLLRVPAPATPRYS